MYISNNGPRSVLSLTECTGLSQAKGDLRVTQTEHEYSYSLLYCGNFNTMAQWKVWPNKTCVLDQWDP